MQKIRLQIMVDQTTINWISNFMQENQLKNESQAIGEMIKQLKRFRNIVQSLENQAHKQQESISSPGTLPGTTTGGNK